jgi:hypothetical protein
MAAWSDCSSRANQAATAGNRQHIAVLPSAQLPTSSKGKGQAAGQDLTGKEAADGAHRHAGLQAKRQRRKRRLSFWSWTRTWRYGFRLELLNS